MNGTALKRAAVGMGSCGIAAGAAKAAEILGERAGITGCIGMCYLEPIVNVGEKIYVRVGEAAALEIKKLLDGEENDAARYEIEDEDLKNLLSQKRVALKNCGLIDPESLADYIAADGYLAAKKALCEMTPEGVIDEIKTSSLGGRGGAGFPTWFKWNAARSSPGDFKYVICNADEGDPGAFMDRAVIEGDPHALIEGMLIAAYAMGACEGVVYVRAEYPLAIKRLENALNQARENGYLGENIMQSGFGFDIRIKAGAGAFVCGEETALIASLEGERGMPRLKPPFPAEKGFWQKPSNINNVETYSNVPWILREGGAAFAEMGTENSKGTKVFALTSKIKKGGLVEIPMGSTIRDVIYGVGGGIKNGREFKAVQMGGPSGGCIPRELLDTVIDYRTTCMVDMARFFLDFTCKESCGKCVHCRLGTKRMLEILERITAGKGKEGDIELLEELGAEVKAGSLCGLGQTAPNPVLTTIRYFRNEYEQHIRDKKCAAESCKPLLTYTIDKEKCTGCTLCARKCPVACISGELKKPHEIDGAKCTKCGNCAEVCRFSAVLVD